MSVTRAKMFKKGTSGSFDFRITHNKTIIIIANWNNNNIVNIASNSVDVFL